MCQGAGLLRRSLGVRAAHVRAGGGRGRSRARGLLARLLPPRPGPLHRDHGHEAVTRDAQEPEAAQAPCALPGREDQALLQARHREAGTEISARPRLLNTTRLGEVYLTAEEIAARVSELGAEIARDYAGREPLLVSSLKASVVFATDLSRAIDILHRIDFVELAAYARPDQGGPREIQLRKDLDAEI